MAEQVGDVGAARTAYEQGIQICMMTIANLSMETLRGVPGAEQKKQAVKKTLDVYVAKLQKLPVSSGGPTVVQGKAAGGGGGGSSAFSSATNEVELQQHFDQVLIDLLAAERLEAYLPGLAELGISNLSQLMVRHFEIFSDEYHIILQILIVLTDLIISGRPCTTM